MIQKRTSVVAILILFLANLLQAQDRPNVLLIVCDDLNDFVGHMGGHPQGYSPNIDALAESGASFVHAYSNNPICAPSRSSFLTGIYPHTSGNFAFAEWFENEVLANSKTLMQYFSENSYQVAGCGKTMHHHKADEWQEYGPKIGQGPVAWDGNGPVAMPSVPEPYRSVGLLDGSFGSLAQVPFVGEAGKGWSLYAWKYEPFHYNSDEDRDLLPDERSAQWAVNRLTAHAQQKAANPDADPLFLAVGFYKPHTPMVAPQKFFEMFPLESIQLPTILANDNLDTHYKDIFPESTKGIKLFNALKASYPTIEEGLAHFLQAYLACVAFVDEQIGVVLDALDTNGLADDTIVILTSDHGWNLGEKDYLFKNSPWEESDRVPFIVRAPGISHAGSRPVAPVSLIDIYPTLVDLCGLTGDTRKNDMGKPLDGSSIRPLLENPQSSEWAGPDVALTMVKYTKDDRNPQPPEAITDALYQHYSLRSEHFRYIRYNDGVEELYDHRNDPFEWNNLAGDAEHESVLREFRLRLGAFFKPNVSGAWMYTFDLDAFQLADFGDGWSWSLALDSLVYGANDEPGWLFVVNQG
ncbi:MAG: sulfatase [Puniceicoccaceae bacterium]